MRPDRPPASVSPPLDPEERERVGEVIRVLARLAGKDGFVRFDQFMEVALYAKNVGFYARRSSPFGKSGDYYTAAHVHPLFGQAVAQRILAIRRALGSTRTFRVVEVGPGDGTLAAAILETLGKDPESRPEIEYVLVERSEPSEEQASQRVNAVGERVGIPVRLSAAVGSDGPFDGVVLANEMLDAQPARRLRWTGETWRELGVRIVDRHLETADAPLVDPVRFPPLPVPPEANWVIEISPAAEGWIRSLADHLVRGVALLIDYGLEESELLRAHPNGTLASVRRHRFVADPLENPGTSDLSVFVNFTRLRIAARRAGLEEVAFRSQAEALGAWGFSALFDSAVRAAGSPEEEVRVRLAAKNLLFGFERFRVLELAAPMGAEAVRAAT